MEANELPKELLKKYYYGRNEQKEERSHSVTFKASPREVRLIRKYFKTFGVMRDYVLDIIDGIEKEVFEEQRQGKLSDENANPDK